MYRFGRLVMIVQLLVIQMFGFENDHKLTNSLLFLPQYLLSSILEITLVGLFFWRLFIVLRSCFKKSKVNPLKSSQKNRYPEASVSLDNTLQPFSKMADNTDNNQKSSKIFSQNDAAAFYLIGLWTLPVIMLDICLSHFAHEMVVQKARFSTLTVELIILGFSLVIFSIIGCCLNKSIA
jgi:hypothetical protein